MLFQENQAFKLFHVSYDTLRRDPEENVTRLRSLSTLTDHPSSCGLQNTSKQTRLRQPKSWTIRLFKFWEGGKRTCFLFCRLLVSQNALLYKASLTLCVCVVMGVMEY